MPQPQLVVELTNLCQLDCLHCVIAGRDPNVTLPTSLYHDILRQGSSYGIRKVGLSGGEPCLHPQFADILDISCQRGFTFSLTTNSWNFSRVFPTLLHYRQGLEWMIFSLDGAREETHDYLRGSGSYQRVIEAMALCREDKIPFQLQMVLTSRSYTEVEDMCNLAKEKGAAVLRFLYLMPTPQSARHGLDLAPERYVEIGAQVAKIAPKYRPSLSVMMLPGPHPATSWMPCEPLSMAVFTVDPYGNLTLCPNLAGYSGGTQSTDAAANLKEVDFEEAHKHLIQMITRFNMDKVEAIGRGAVSTRDGYFPCWYCAKYFQKTGWLKEFPDNPWNEPVESNQAARARAA